MNPPPLVYDFLPLSLSVSKLLEISNYTRIHVSNEHQRINKTHTIREQALFGLLETYLYGY